MRKLITEARTWIADRKNDGDGWLLLAMVVFVVIGSVAVLRNPVADLYTIVA